MLVESLVIRKAISGEADAILACRREAINVKALASYGPEMTAVWANAADDQLTKVEEEIMDPKSFFLVADHVQLGIIGFGIVFPHENEFRALYVRPNPCGLIGTRILNALLEATKATDCLYLEGEGSLNAESFYIRHGFRVLSRGVHHLRTGQAMDSFRMRIDFPAENRPE